MSNLMNGWSMRSRAPGHTILIALKQERGGHYCVTLECSCGRVFASKNCLPSEQQIAKGLIIDEGREGASEHVAQIDEAVKMLQAGKPCV